MPRVPFDKFEFVRRLERVGVERDQAEEHMAVLRDVAADNLVMRGEFENIDERLKSLEQKLTIKFGTITAAGIGVLAVLMKVLGG
jgi:hypothetical protein